MSESVSLPALGESVTEGTVTRWLKKVGDRVEVDEPLVEVSTDKVDTEIPSPIAGIVEAILVAEDETVEVGTALVTIGDGGGTAPDAAPAAASAAPVAEAAAPAPEAAAAAATPEVVAPATVAPATVAAVPVDSVPAAVDEAPAAPAAPAPEAVAVAEAPEAAPAPEAAAIAVAPEAVPAPEAASAPAPGPAPAAVLAPAPVLEPAAPTAPPSAPPATEPAAPGFPSVNNAAAAGYVTPLVRKLAHERGVDLSTVTGTGVGGRIRKQDVYDLSENSTTAATAPTAAPQPAAEVSPLRGTTVSMSRLRKVIAERAVISLQSSAQLTSVVEVDVSLVAAYRGSVKDAFLAKTGVKLTFLPFFALAATEALATYPIINATIDGDSISYPAQENLSIAVDTERGLLTPVIRDAAGLTLAQLATQIADLAERTRENKLKPDELAGGTFTLTNTGSRGALFDTPIVFLPQSAILGTGVVTKKPVVLSDSSGDAIAIRSTVYLALSYDHRIVDGADAARFLVAIKTRLEAGAFSANLGI